MPDKAESEEEYILVKKSVLDELIRTIKEMRAIIGELKEGKTVKSK